MVQYTENGLKLILEFKIFDILQKVMQPGIHVMQPGIHGYFVDCERCWRRNEAETFAAIIAGASMLQWTGGGVQSRGAAETGATVPGHQSSHLVPGKCENSRKTLQFCFLCAFNHLHPERCRVKMDERQLRPI